MLRNSGDCGLVSACGVANGSDFLLGCSGCGIESVGCANGSWESDWESD